MVSSPGQADSSVLHIAEGDEVRAVQQYHAWVEERQKILCLNKLLGELCHRGSRAKAVIMCEAGLVEALALKITSTGPLLQHALGSAGPTDGSAPVAGEKGSANPGIL